MVWPEPVKLYSMIDLVEYCVKKGFEDRLLRFVDEDKVKATKVKIMVRQVKGMVHA